MGCGSSSASETKTTNSQTDPLPPPQQETTMAASRAAPQPPPKKAQLVMGFSEDDSGAEALARARQRLGAKPLVPQQEDEDNGEVKDTTDVEVPPMPPPLRPDATAVERENHEAQLLARRQQQAAQLKKRKQLLMKQKAEKQPRVPRRYIPADHAMVLAVTYSTDERFFFAADENGVLVCFAARAPYKELWRVELESMTGLEPSSISSIAVNNTQLIGPLHAADTLSLEMSGTTKTQPSPSQRASSSTLSRVMVGSRTGLLAVFDAEKAGRLVCETAVSSQNFSDLGLGPISLGAASSSADEETFLSISCLCVSPDNLCVFTGHDQGVILCHAARFFDDLAPQAQPVKRPLGMPTAGTLYGFTTERDSERWKREKAMKKKIIAAQKKQGGPGVGNPQLPYMTTGLGSVWSLVFSANAQLLFAASDDMTIAAFLQPQPEDASMGVLYARSWWAGEGAEPQCALRWQLGQRSPVIGIAVPQQDERDLVVALHQGGIVEGWRVEPRGLQTRNGGGSPNDQVGDDEIEESSATLQGEDDEEDTHTAMRYGEVNTQVPAASAVLLSRNGGSVFVIGEGLAIFDTLTLQPRCEAHVATSLFYSDDVVEAQSRAAATAMSGRISVPLLTCGAMSMNGLIMLTGDANGQTRLLDVSSFQRPEQLHFHKGTVTSLCLGGAKYGISGSEDTTICVWELLSGRRLHIMEGHTSRVWSVAQVKAPFSSAAATAATSAAAAKRQQQQTAVLSSLIVSGGEDGTVRVWSLALGKQLDVAPADAECVWAVASEEGWAFTGGSEGVLRAWTIKKPSSQLNKSTSTTANVPASKKWLKCVRGMRGHAQAITTISVMAFRTEEQIRLPVAPPVPRTESANGTPPPNEEETVEEEPDDESLAKNTDRKGDDDGASSSVFTSEGKSDRSSSKPKSKANSSTTISTEQRPLKKQHEPAPSKHHTMSTSSTFTATRSTVRQRLHLFVLTGSMDCTLRLWDMSPTTVEEEQQEQQDEADLTPILPHGTCLRIFRGHTDVVWACTFLQASTLVEKHFVLRAASASEDGHIKIWNVKIPADDGRDSFGQSPSSSTTHHNDHAPIEDGQPHAPSYSYELGVPMASAYCSTIERSVGPLPQLESSEQMANGATLSVGTADGRLCHFALDLTIQSSTSGSSPKKRPQPRSADGANTSSEVENGAPLLPPLPMRLVSTESRHQSSVCALAGGRHCIMSGSVDTTIQYYEARNKTRLKKQDEEETAQEGGTEQPSPAEGGIRRPVLLAVLSVSP